MNAFDNRRLRITQREPLHAAASVEFDALDRTHARMLATLADLERLMDHLEAHGIDDQARADAAMVCEFFASTARDHHATEEQQVFPQLLRQADADLMQCVERLQQDHGWLEEDWIELEPQLQAVARGYSWYDLDTLRHAVDVFATLYQEHIALEENVVYPAARRLGAVPARGAEAGATPTP
ncbi:MAG: hemerythrin domain-containing protein [Burkholderiaceae bacterium]|jgi:hemerythrin-like domain-containing protein|nr:hemerythrin domain-containing protein [Aquabacterium sp.]NUP85228.1 hemerythrin domain-containing protein [Burkholderiaceae bacterium]